MAEEHQGLGYGQEKNGLSANAIIQIGRFANRVPNETVNIKNYLVEISRKYRNEVGYAAVVSLYDLSKEAGDQQKANQYLIEMNSYPSTPEYKSHSWPVLRKWEQIDSVKANVKQ